MSFHHAKDAIDLIQGHYIVSVSRDTAASSQKGGLEAIAVSTFLSLVLNKLETSILV